MSYKAGYWVDLADVKLDESSGVPLSWIQAMPLGDYKHPMHGKISFTPERIQRFADNVNNNVRGQDLDIDYDHKERTGEAAGWVKQAEAHPTQGLRLLVEWTTDAAQKIKSKAYRYFSPEFTDEWEHPKTGEKFTDVVFGGGITNRPFLKDILPINLSELVADVPDNTPAGGGSMDPKELRKLLGLAEDATEDAVKTALQERLKAPVQDPVGAPDDTKDQQPAPVAASEGLSGVLKLAEASQDPAVKALAEYVQNQEKTIQTQGVALQLAETNARMVRLNEKAAEKKFAFPPTVTQALTEALVALPKALSDKVYQAFYMLAETGTVPLGENADNDPNVDSGDAIKRFQEAVKKVQTDDKLDYAEAVNRVAALQPQLFDEMRSASYSFREV